MALQSLSRAASLGQLARVTALAVPAPVSGVNSLFFDLLLYGLGPRDIFCSFDLKSLVIISQIFWWQSYNFSNIMVTEL